MNLSLDWRDDEKVKKNLNNFNTHLGKHLKVFFVETGKLKNRKKKIFQKKTALDTIVKPKT